MSQGTGSSGKPEQENNGTSEVVDFSKIREQKLDEKRRKTERIFFKQILGVYSVSEDHMRQIELVDVSENGCAFLTPFNENDPWPAESTKMPIRIYFSQDTYISIGVEIKNSTPFIEDGIRKVRFGCEIKKDTVSYETYKLFIKFLNSYAKNAHKDNGQVSHYYL